MSLQNVSVSTHKSVSLAQLMLRSAVLVQSQIDNMDDSLAALIDNQEMSAKVSSIKAILSDYTAKWTDIIANLPALPGGAKATAKDLAEYIASKTGPLADAGVDTSKLDGKIAELMTCMNNMVSGGVLDKDSMSNPPFELLANGNISVSWTDSKGQSHTLGGTDGYPSFAAAFDALVADAAKNGDDEASSALLLGIYNSVNNIQHNLVALTGESYSFGDVITDITKLDLSKLTSQVQKDKLDTVSSYYVNFTTKNQAEFSKNQTLMSAFKSSVFDTLKDAARDVSR